MNDQCPICYNEFSEDIKCTLMDCAHLFCQQCVYAFTLPSLDSMPIPRCPLDNKEIKSIHYIDPLSNVHVNEETKNVLLDIFSKWYPEASTKLHNTTDRMLSFIDELSRPMKRMEYFNSIISKESQAVIVKEFSYFDEHVLTKISSFWETFDENSASISEEFHDVLIRYTNYFHAVEMTKRVNHCLYKINVYRVLVKQTLLYQEFVAIIIENFNNIYDLVSIVTRVISMNKSTIDGITVCYENLRVAYAAITEYAVWTKVLLQELTDATAVDAPPEKLEKKCIVCLSTKKKYLSRKKCNHYVCTLCSNNVYVSHHGCNLYHAKSDIYSNIEALEDKSYANDKKNFINETHTYHMIWTNIYQNLRQDCENLMNLVDKDSGLKKKKMIQIKKIMNYLIPFEKKVMHCKLWLSRISIAIQCRLVKYAFRQSKLVEEYEDICKYVEVAMMNPLLYAHDALKLLKRRLALNYNVMQDRDCEFIKVTLQNIVESYVARLCIVDSEIDACLQTFQTINHPDFEHVINTLSTAMKAYRITLKKSY